MFAPLPDELGRQDSNPRFSDQNRMCSPTTPLPNEPLEAYAAPPPTLILMIAVILAAGQGTRMRSKTPKVLPPVCGRPMLLWSVEAARAAGASKVVVVGGPDRAVEPILPPDTVLAVQEQAL